MEDKSWNLFGMWWWSSGQRACLLLQRSKFEIYRFSVKFVFVKTENKPKEVVGIGHFLNFKFVEIIFAKVGLFCPILSMLWKLLIYHLITCIMSFAGPGWRNNFQAREQFFVWKVIRQSIQQFFSEKICIYFLLRDWLLFDLTNSLLILSLLPMQG